MDDFAYEFKCDQFNQICDDERREEEERRREWGE